MDHINNLDKVLEKLEDAGLKIHASNSCFASHELEYLGYCIAQDGIQPVSRKVDAITQMSHTQTRKNLRRFIGMVNYCRDMWALRSEILAPLSELASDNVPFKWTQNHQEAFDKIKK